MEDCSICLENLNHHKEEYTLNCNHSFHKECLTKWLDVSLVCPLCRSSVKITPEIDEEHVKNLKKIACMTAGGMEWLMPRFFNGFKSNVDLFVNSEIGERILYEFFKNN